jgi:LacI family transcriptional regulator
MGKKNIIDIYLIAKESGVSIATVSRYFNNESVVSDKTGDKISQVCKKYNYKPLSVARALTTRKTKSIALSIPSIRQPAFTDLISAVEKVTSSHNYALILNNTKDSVDRELEFLDIIDNRLIDGIIVSGVYGYDEDKVFINEIQKRNILHIMVESSRGKEMSWLEQILFTP